MTRARLLAPAVVVAFLACVGCGKKGALYRPGEAPPQKTQSQQPAEASPPATTPPPAK